MTQPILSRRSVLGVFGLAGLAATAGCGSSVGGSGSGGGGGGGGSASGGAIKVGLIIPQDGVYTPLGVDMKNAWDLYLDQHDGMLGGYEVETVVGDEGEGPDTGVPAIQGLIQRDNVDVLVGIVNSASALGSAEAIAAAKKVLVISNAGAIAVTGEARNPYIWRASFTNAQAAFAMGEYLAGQQPEGGVYLMAPDYAAGQETFVAFKESYEGGGGTVAGEALTPFGTTQDFQPFLSAIPGSGAGATFVFYSGGEAVSFVQQYASFGLKETVPLYGSGFLTEGSVLEAQGEAAVGIQTALHYSTEIDNPANTEFVEAYQEAYDVLPTCFAVQTWDAALVLDLALAESEDLSGDAVSEALGGLGEISDSPRGPWTFDGQSPKHIEYLREVQEGEGGLINVVVEELGEYGQ